MTVPPQSMRSRPQLVLSPSSAFAYMLGSIQLGFAGDVERAIEWASEGCV